MFADAYRDAHVRVAALARSLPAESLDTPTPSCPDWTARDVVAHLAGMATDVTSGRLRGMPGPDWTGPQVRDRTGRDLETVLDEWAGTADAVAEAVEDRRVPLTVLQDALAHEADLAEATGRPRPAQEGWVTAAQLMTRQVLKGMRGPGTLIVRSGGSEWRGGDDDPVSVVDVDPYELYRGLLSRRSRAQMRGWAWRGDPEPWVAVLPVFGPRDDDQPVPPPS